MSWEQVQTFLNRPLFTIGDTEVLVSAVMIALLVLVLTLWISRLLERGVVRVLQVAGVDDEGTLGVSGRISHYFALVVGFAIALDVVGFNLTTLFAAGAVLAVAIGFAAQNVLQNFFSGLILLSEGVIKPGDVLHVDGVVVKVTRMGIRSTVARTRDDEELILPNTVLAQSTVKNYTLQDSRYRLRTLVGVTYGSDMEQVKQVLYDAAAGLTFRRDDRDPVVLMKEFGDSSVNFDVSVWIDDPWGSQQFRSDLNGAIWFALKDAGITIAFPQLDVHLDAQVVDRLGKSGRG